MVNWKKRLTICALLGTMTIASLTGCGSVKDSEVVATVGKDNITVGVANFAARMQQAQYETYYAGMMGTTGEEMWTKEVETGKTYESYVKETLLTNLEDLYLIRQHASDYDVSLTDEEKTKINEAAADFEEANSLEEKTAVSGFEKYITEYLELVTIQSKMDPEMKKGVDEEVSDDEAAQKKMSYAFFPYTNTDESGNVVDMSEEEKTALKDKVQGMLDEVKAGADFNQSVADAGGEVQTTTFDASSTTPDADLIAAVDALKEEGSVTELVVTDNGIYAAQLTSLFDKEATESKKQSIVEERRQNQYDSLVEGWRKETEVKEDNKIWNKISFKDLGVTVRESADEYDNLSE